MTAETLALFLSGLVASPLIQFVKERLGWEGAKAEWLSYIVCVVLALISLLASGELTLAFVTSEPVTFIAQLGVLFAAVLGLATIIYNAKFKKY